jgi:hypothetical protein
MLGTAALAMWWDMAPAMRHEFEHWHSHEHFAERLALPGFRRATRWADAAGGEGFFILYELATYEALVSPEYLARLNAPSNWSRRMMPHHRNMVRSQCRVAASGGAAVAGHALTVRLAPAAGGAEPLRAYLGGVLEPLPGRAGFAGAHLLQTDTPVLPATTEQEIRGLADRAADWIVLVTGYDIGSLNALRQDWLSGERLAAAGAAPGALPGTYGLRLSALREDLPPTR